jgi:hypothetical protein
LWQGYQEEENQRKYHIREMIESSDKRPIWTSYFISFC